MFFQAYIFFQSGNGFLNSKYIIYATLSGDILVIIIINKCGIYYIKSEVNCQSQNYLRLPDYIVADFTERLVALQNIICGHCRQTVLHIYSRSSDSLTDIAERSLVTPRFQELGC